MKKNLLLKRILSAVLTIVLLASAIPVSLAVQELFTEELPAQIVREVPELREESVKHFLCDDGSISLTESGDTANEIFWIEAPYMYDANSDESFAVTMSLTEVEGKYVLAVEADKDWINAADRSFPEPLWATLPKLRECSWKIMDL